MVELYIEYGQLFEWFPYLSLSIAIVLAASFNNSRLFTLSASLLATYILIQYQLQTTLDRPDALFLFTAISLALPVLTLFLILVKEKGFRNTHGVMIIISPVLLVIMLLILFRVLPTSDLVAYINTYFSPRPFNGYVLSAGASLIHLLVISTGVYRLVRSREDFPAIASGTLAYSMVTLALFNLNKISTIVFAVAGLVLIFSLLRSSHNMAFRDDLTGLLGRRALNERLKGLGKRYVIAMTDVDHFKKFNDTYGHDIGDDVLRMVGRKIAGVQGGGTPYRYGGEEFCIVFPGKTLEECEPFLEVLRKSVENHHMTVRDTEHRPDSQDVALERRGRRTQKRGEKTVSVTISIGAAARNLSQTRPEQVLKAADAALYRAKKNGRNCLKLA